MNTLDQQIDYLREQLGIRDSQVLNDLLNSYSNAQISLQNQLVKQQQRIDRAIEHIEESLCILKGYSDIPILTGNVRNRYLKPVLDILGGKNNG